MRIISDTDEDEKQENASLIISGNPHYIWTRNGGSCMMTGYWLLIIGAAFIFGFYVGLTY